MITQISYNVLIERFRAFATGHYLIEAFTHGELAQTDLEKDQRFPWMHVFPVEVEPRQGSRLYTFVVTFADLPRDKETDAEYQRESLSDCIRLAEDLLAEIQNGLILFGPTVELEGSATIEPFIKEFTHTLTGVNLTLTISVPWDWSACDIPADFSVGGSGSGGSGSGGAGLILETNGVLNGSQSLLNLQQGTNVTITDDGSGTITISATGGGGGGGGTVTSVALTAPPALSVSGSPITGAGTLAISGAGTSGDYIDGSGNLQTFPAIPTELRDLSDVNISGPVQNDTLIFNALSNQFDNGQLAAVAYSNDYNDLDNLPTIPAAQIQSDWAQANTAALDYIKNKPTLPATVGDMLKSVYDLQDIGVVEAAHKELVAVINKTGASVPAGSIVYLKTSSASGTFPEIVLATATTESGSSKTMGAVWQTIANDATGYVVTSGEVSNLDTSAYSIGDRLWLGTTAGSVTTTPPAEPNHTVFIGTVTRAQNGNGRILYAIQNGYELNELHGVQISTEANRQVLIYDSASSLWVNRLLEAADMPTGIDAANIGAGTVSNTEFGYLDGVTSAIQNQLNNKKDTITYGQVYATTVTAGSTAYFAITGITAANATESNRQFAVPVSGIIRDFYIKMSGTQSATGTLVITLRKNGISSAVSVTVSNADGASPVKSDTTNTISITAGDLIAIQTINNASVASASILSMAFIIERT